MKRFIYSILAVGMLMTACSDDLKVEQEVVPAGYLQISMAIPDPTKVETRDTKEDSEAEKKINDVMVFIFDNAGTNLLSQSEISGSSLTGDGDVKTFTVPFSDSKSEKSPVVYVVINGKNQLTGDYTTVEQVEAVSKSLVDGKVEESSSDYNFIMGGRGTGASNKVSLSVNRIASKMTLQNNGANNFELTGFEIRNAANAGNIGASTNETYKFNTSGDKKIMTAQKDGSGLLYTYLYPSKAMNSVTEDNSSTDAYIIVRGKYKGSKKESYYRIELKNGTTKYDFEPNNWYEGKITSVLREGYSSADDAARHPDDESMHYTIHDHASDVSSMATDGQRELGVSSRVVYNSSGDTYLIVKRYSKVSGEENTDPNFEIIEGDDWLEIAATGIGVTETPVTHEDDNDNPGTIKKYKLSLVDNNVTTKLGDLTATVRVSWLGLSRDVIVEYNSDFAPQEIFSETKLEMTGYLSNSDEQATTYTITDYWNFIKQSGTQRNPSHATAEDSPKLYGVGEQDMGSEKLRNRGLHFPMYYGPEDGKTWTYTYYLTLDSEDFNNVSSISYDAPEDSFMTENLKVEPVVGVNNQIKVTLNHSGEEYTYATGTLTLIVEYDNGKSAELPINVYHTGFFHWDKADKTYRKYLDGEDTSAAYYYYEVVGMKDRHWLDRNLGATSTGLYIEDSSGNSVLGDVWPFRTGARGGYYIVADEDAEFNNSNEKTAFNDPNFSKAQAAICPPGYRVPTKDEWDGMRMSANMTSQQSTNTSNQSFYSSYYTSETEGAGNIYFPKGRYFSGDQKVGDASSGYYWTRTPSSGLEKDEIGRWLKALNMIGESSSFINAYVNPIKATGNPAYMSVRLISNEVEPETGVHTFGFKVKGATHVYIYSYDGDSKMGIFSWPGRAVTTSIGSSNTVYFIYNTSLNIDDLYVLFTYVDDTTGHIYTLDSSGDCDTELKDAKGWKVVNDGTYSFNLTPSGAGSFTTNEVPPGATVDSH